VSPTICEKKKNGTELEARALNFLEEPLKNKMLNSKEGEVFIVLN
jgi:hypothetical protein